MRHLSTAAIVASILLASAAGAQQQDPKKLKDQLTGDTKAAASANPQCQLFTPAEISLRAGTTLGSGENAAGGTGCMWTAKDHESSAMVQVVAARFFTELTGVKGYKKLPGVGTRGWVAPDGGWSAGAIDGKEGIVVAITGNKATEALAIALLQDVIKRRQK